MSGAVLWLRLPGVVDATLGPHVNTASFARVPSLVTLAICASAGAAHAEVDVRRLAAAARAPSGTFSPQRDLSAIVELPEGEDAAVYGLPRIGGHFSVVRAPLSDLELLASVHPGWSVTWSGPLRPLLDRVAGWVNLAPFRNDTGLTGKGTFVGIVDTGVDPSHPDLRNADGSTRIAYLIDFSAQPIGHFPDAEKRCTAMKLTCAVRSAADIDAVLRGGNPAALPGDTVGHGTHVASLAAGNGGAEKKYVGLAPEASIIAARVVDSTGQISDAAVLAGTDLVFYLAEQEGQKAGKQRIPAVVNLSLGSDFGPHDGTTSLERALADFVGPNQPGRAIVVAAGNSAGLIDDETQKYPNPFGVHTEVNVPERSSVLVPLVHVRPEDTPATVNASVLVWIKFRPNDDVSVGIDRGSGPWIPPQGQGTSKQFAKGDLTATIVNGSLSDVGFDNQNAAAVLLEGKWPRDEVFKLRLEGTGTASFWVESSGDLGQDKGSLGLLFPAATKESTLTIPAANEELIAVGATLNRSDWTDRDGQSIRLEDIGGLVLPPMDSVAFFSSAGPTTDLRIKPDLVAPGGFVVGAMSRGADPRTNPASIFAEGFCTPPESCAVVDDTHAVTVGTSMAAPIVSGAVALLFQGDPTLTSDRVLAILQAGARKPEGLAPHRSQLGAGALDLEGALDVEREIASPVAREPVAEASFMTLGQEYAHPAPDYRVPGYLTLRTGDGHVADGFDASSLAVDVEHGVVVEGLTRVAPGFYSFAVGANGNTGGDHLDVQIRYRGQTFAEASLPIAVDVNVARSGFFAQGGCSAASGRRGAPPDAAGGFAIASLGLIGLRGRRRRRAARTVRSPDRTGS
jgi:subtilisin family serine protease